MLATVAMYALAIVSNSLFNFFDHNTSLCSLKACFNEFRGVLKVGEDGVSSLDLECKNVSLSQSIAIQKSFGIFLGFIAFLTFAHEASRAIVASNDPQVSTLFQSSLPVP
jgi:hypothetical protein